MTFIKNTTAILLAGGNSARMGEDKGLMLFQGKPMLAHIIETVQTLTDQIIIIANDEQYKQFGFPVYKDIISEKGPLAGLVTGLTHTNTELNWVISCDTPFVKTNLLTELIDQLTNFDAVIPIHSKKHHPLIAAYKKSALKPLKDQLDLNNLAMMKANQAIHVNYWNIDHLSIKMLKNINSKQDI